VWDCWRALGQIAKPGAVGGKGGDNAGRWVYGRQSRMALTLMFFARPKKKRPPQYIFLVSGWVFVQSRRAPPWFPHILKMRMNLVPYACGDYTGVCSCFTDVEPYFRDSPQKSNASSSPRAVPLRVATTGEIRNMVLIVTVWHNRGRPSSGGTSLARCQWFATPGRTQVLERCL